MFSGTNNWWIGGKFKGHKVMGSLEGIDWGWSWRGYVIGCTGRLLGGVIGRRWWLWMELFSAKDLMVY